MFYDKVTIMVDMVRKKKSNKLLININDHNNEIIIFLGP